MNHIELSIIIPVYNIEKYLDRCIQSILKQSFQNFEIILINDGSTDNSKSICDKYASENDKIIAIHQKNKGVSAARNAGLSIAKGKYITFVDSDDFIAPNTYDFNMEYLREHSDIDILQYPYCDYYNEEKMQQHLVPSQTIKGKESLFLHWWSGTPIGYAIWNKIFKREIFNGLHFMEGHTSEDTCLVPLFCQRTKKMYLSEKGMYFYQTREGSYTFSYSFDKHIDLFNAHYTIFQEFKNYPQYTTEKVLAFTRIYRRLIQAYTESPDKDISQQQQLLSSIFPSWKEIFHSKQTEKAWLYTAKILGCKCFTNLFIWYLSYKPN